MGLRLRVHDGESIAQALRRFKKLAQQHGTFWEKAHRAERFGPATQIRRKKRFLKRFKARLATLSAQQTGEQPVASLEEASEAFWKRRGKP